jgi:MerR-like DNA binding protein
VFQAMSEPIMNRIDDSVLVSLERQYASGLASGELIDVCAAHGIQLSEATLRKYVQLGLLPRSVRVGRKGKHKGSLGMYPARAIRQLVRIKEMMAESYTIEEIRRDFLFVRTDIEQLEQTLGSIFQVLARVIKQRRQDTSAPIVLQQVNQAKRQSRELVSQLSSIESLLSRRSRLPGAGVGAEVSRARAS